MTTILIVEDNEMNRDMLSRRLARKGYDILLAEDGEIGLEVARAKVPDIVLMDMSLPVVDGWEATRRMKADDDLRHIPIIALTAHAMEGDRQRCLDAGMDGYVAKPIKPIELFEVIDRVVAAAQPA